MRGGPGGLCAASCSSTSASVAPGGRGTSSAERVPTARRAPPAASDVHAAARSASSTPESRRTQAPSLARRCAQRPAASTSGVSTSAGAVSRATTSRSRASRPAPTSSSGGSGRRGDAARSSTRAGSRCAACRPPASAAGGGRRARHVDPNGVRLSAAIHSASASSRSPSSGTSSTRRCRGLRPSPSPSRTPTTTPMRTAPRRGAATRWPRPRDQSSGTRYENGWGSGASNATSAIVTTAHPPEMRGPGSSRAPGVVLPLGELEIFPGHALVLLTRVAQQECRMEGRNQHGAAVWMEAPAQLADRLLRLEQRLRGHAAEREHHLRLQDGELRGQERRARGQLVGLGVAIAGRPTKDCIRDVHLVARELDRLEHLGQELACAADEGLALDVLVGAGTLPDHHKLGLRVARAEDDGRPALAQPASPAALELALLALERLRLRHQVDVGEREVGHPEVAVVAEDVAERGKRLGQGAAGVRQRLTRSARIAAAARTSSTWLRIASATADLGIRGSARSPPQRSIMSTWLSSDSKPMSRRLTSLTTSSSTPFAVSLARAWATTSCVSAANPTTKAPVCRAPTSARISGFGASSSARSRLPLIFSAAICLTR